MSLDRFARARGASRLAGLLLVLVAGANLGADCGPPPAVTLPGSGAALFTSPQTNPLALSADGTRLYVANTTSGSLSIVDVTSAAAPVELAKIKVGLDPVGVAVRPKLDPDDPNEDELVFVANHVSDSISVVSRGRREVVQTIQGRDADGVSTTDEPVGIAFAGPDRAFVTLDQPNQVLVLALDASGRATIAPQRIAVPAQAPRALAVAGNRLFVAAFESNNQTEFPTCSPTDTRTLNPDPTVYDQGCQFKLRIARSFSVSPSISFQPDTLFNFATGPNIGGRVIHDGDAPDRDLFVYDATTLAPVTTVSGLSTLLYGLAVGNGGSRVYVTSTEARNVNNGLQALGNRMFENRLSYLDCTGGCTGLSAPVHVDLDAAAPGATTVPTPYGVAVSGDGATLVATAAGSDGVAGWNGDAGLYTLSATGAVLGRLRVGAIPQGVALRSGAGGAAQTAFVLNTVDSTISAVDVSTPASPTLLATLPVGSDPTPSAVKRGRIAFSTARASTGGTFSCESCHPNGNTDQLLWTINTIAGPGGSDPGNVRPEPRTTMPVRGLRDTLPLHWDGSLGDPVAGAFVPGDTAPDCSLASGDAACFRDLVDASLSGVMCSQPACASGPSGLAGALSSAERDDLAAFLGAVSFPPSPRRRPDDALSTTAAAGMRDFFTDDDGLGVAHNVGPLLGFAPVTCADNTAGCHALPLTVSTNSQTVGRFDAPSIRGLWDRWIIFSNGVMSSEEGLRLAQDCANGVVPPGQPLSGDPCNPLNLNPHFPTGAQVYDPAVGMTERGTFLGSFELAFDLFYGVPGDRIWEFVNEMSVGLPGLAGQQRTLDAANAASPDTVAWMARLEAAATEGRATAVATSATLGEFRYRPSTGLWTTSAATALSGAQLRDAAAAGFATITVSADLPESVAPGGPRQPLLFPETAEAAGSAPPLPRPAAGGSATVRLGQRYVDAAAKVLIDGAVCGGCSVALGTGAGGIPIVDVTLSPVPPAGAAHALQLLNPSGLASNELPVMPQ